MGKTEITAFLSAAAVVAMMGLFGHIGQAQTASNNMIGVTSFVFSEGEMIPKKYTCDGSNAIPPLGLSGILEGAKSLAIIVDDPDAPTGNFNHWVIWNIDPKTPKIDEGSVPVGAIQGMNSAGKNSYVGPCPPSGTHRYYFKVYALDQTLDLGSSAKKDDLEKAVENHIIGQGQLMGKYAR
jgi:Raf kinase inhibitor-like YbhB/YbcL family protein